MQVESLDGRDGADFAVGSGSTSGDGGACAPPVRRRPPPWQPGSWRVVL